MMTVGRQYISHHHDHQLIKTYQKCRPTHPTRKTEVYNSWHKTTNLQYWNVQSLQNPYKHNKGGGLMTNIMPFVLKSWLDIRRLSSES